MHYTIKHNSVDRNAGILSQDLNLIIHALMELRTSSTDMNDRAQQLASRLIALSENVREDSARKMFDAATRNGQKVF